MKQVDTSRLPPSQRKKAVKPTRIQKICVLCCKCLKEIVNGDDSYIHLMGRGKRRTHKVCPK